MTTKSCINSRFPSHVNDVGTHLCCPDDQPFLYLADTAWELVHRLKMEEVDYYLKHRKAQGYTATQIVLLAELGGLDSPNAYGEAPLVDNDPARPNPAYFDYVDKIIDRIGQAGMVAAVLPTWGDKVTKLDRGHGPEIFDTEAKAEAWGSFVARRFQQPNIIWVLGGDRNPLNPQHMAIWRAMAAGIRNADTGKRLMTYHPEGYSASSKYFHDDDWLDFNMLQTGHGERNNPNYLRVKESLALSPQKPCLDGEPCYEEIPVAFWLLRNGGGWEDINVSKEDFDNFRGWFSAEDCRQAAWWGILGGACGHTYGHNSMWQCYAPPHKPVIAAYTSWQEAVTAPGGIQVGRVRSILASLPCSWSDLRPDDTLIGGQGAKAEDAGGALAAVTADRQTVLVYLPLERDNLESAFLDTTQFDSVVSPIRLTFIEPATGKTVEKIDLDRKSGQVSLRDLYKPFASDGLVLLTR